MDYSINTKCVQAGYTPGNGEPRQIPIYQSTLINMIPVKIWANCLTSKHPVIFIPDFRIRQMIMLLPKSPHSKAALPEC